MLTAETILSKDNEEKDYLRKLNTRQGDCPTERGCILAFASHWVVSIRLGVRQVQTAGELPRGTKLELAIKYIFFVGSD